MEGATKAAEPSVLYYRTGICVQAGSAKGTKYLELYENVSCTPASEWRAKNI